MRTAHRITLAGLIAAIALFLTLSVLSLLLSVLAVTDAKADARVYFMGDPSCDSRIDETDSRILLTVVAGIETTGYCGPVKGADVDCDDRLTAVDALLILRYVAGMSVPTFDGCPVIGSPL